MTELVVPNVTAVAIGGRALLIEGPPGSGKSSLALALIDRGATLIGDDGITLQIGSDAICVCPPPNTAGLLEIRGVGLVTLPTCRARAALVLALCPDAPRSPGGGTVREYGGIAIPLLEFRSGDGLQAIRAEYALESFGLRLAAPRPGVDTAQS